MKKTIALLALLLPSFMLMMAEASEKSEKPVEYRRLPVKEYRDKMKAGWIGQMAGVSWGASAFEYCDKIMPESAMPKWRPRMINGAFNREDLYVEMTFLRTMEQHGLDCSIRQAGIDFANSGYPLFNANSAGRMNLRKGIAPPDSGHPKFNRCPNDIGYQIEADYSGLIAPGLPNVPVALGEKFGRLMNYGDGMCAGQFMGAMYAEAFFEADVVKVIQAGLKAIPAESQYAEMVRDMLKWSKEVPEWEKCWQLCQEKYRKNPEYQKASNGGTDCKINGAYILMGLLYGKGDIDQTIIIACRCGQDSDCNPSSAGGVLFTAVGFSKLPERFTKELIEKSVFRHTPYNFPALLDVCEDLARQGVVKDGGRIEKDANGEEVFVIPVKPVKPSQLELSWAPGPTADSKFTKSEMVQIEGPRPLTVKRVQRPVVIDGDLKEWEGVPPVVIACTLATKRLFKNNKDCSLLAYFMWDEQNLYMAARIMDDQEVYGQHTGGGIYEEDTVELWVNKCQMGIGRTKSGDPSPWVWPNYAEPSASVPKKETSGDIKAAYKLVKDLGSSKEMGVLDKTQGGGVKGGCGRIMECAIPHATTGLAGKAGVAFRLAIGVDDNDPDEWLGVLGWPRDMEGGLPETFQPTVLSE